ncbi:hypothetical protein, unknown function [Leishmania infantum JPCM5]|uniref:Uncharacterized protein n=2 Tax=Leishmania infantum TaxID=5671 RepID=A4HRQ9_LEIIN|nr:hypothetical protein, unknown function [Leishmania infantum JPCM5]CAC9438063.1 hypothetical_protein_-_conserved [Leishmania infantum]CAM65292.1 hypothetical protein, unknown function [Leishmania infantum JPCM5]SUZ38686.1 hypothetical_protein_-_conserved [Leishmania infantum]|eukprot:XP_001462751.1 hypothetical protein, unknown function [Leishmania infantum JPCM5]
MPHQRGEEDNSFACACPNGVRSTPAGGADDHRTEAALRLVRDVLLTEDWFVERPPLALAFAHPYIRLWCEMWRTEYVGDLHAPAAHESPVAEPPHKTRRPAAPPASYVRIGLRRLRNPIAFANPASAGVADILSGGVPLTSSSAVLSSSPNATAAQRTVRSLVAPVLTYPEPADVMESEPLYDAAAVRGIPVVDPTAPLFALEAYTEHVFRMPIGMRLGHVRLLTLWLPCHCPSHATPVNQRARLVRGLFSHVPASVTHDAAMKATACIHTAEAQQAVRHEPQPMAAPAVSSQHVKGSSGGATTLNIDADAGAAKADDSDSSAEQGSAHMEEVVEDDDWEAMALEEEALLEKEPLSVSTAAATVAPRMSDSPGLQEAPQARTCFSLFPTHHPSLPAAATSPAITASSDTSVVAAAPEPFGGASAVIEGVCVALPPPCGWWLRRGVRPSSALHGAPLPLYAHCIDATRPWLDWLEATARGTSDALPDKDGRSATQTFLCGVSLSGWLPKYVQPTIVSRAELAQRSVSVKLEDAISSTLPLRGLHIESSVRALKRLLGGRSGERGDPGGGAALLGTLVALDAPYLRDAEPDLLAGRDRLTASDDGDAGSLASALCRLRRLRFLSMNHGRDVLAEAFSPSPAQTAVFSTCVEALLLHGVTGLAPRTLASVGRCCVSLRTVDLTSTSVTDDELRALVYGRWDTPCKGSKPAACLAKLSPLACLEEVRLTACRSLTCVDALAALPQLRRLDLRASGVRQVADLAGCHLLEEVVLTRCEHVTELYPLWRLPRLRCVEADGVRQLQQYRALMPPAASTAEEDEGGDECFVAPLARLNLSQAAVIRGASVGYLARRLRDLSGHFTSLVALLLDHTDADDDTLRALAGFSTAEAESGHFAGRWLPVASSLRELSLVGCVRVHHLGPLGMLPQLTRLVADHSGVEHVDGLQHSRSLDSLYLSHCTRLWVISPLAYVTSLRCVDLSHTPLTDAALLRFVYPTVVEKLTARRHPHLGEIVVSLQACTATPAPLVPSQVEELRLCHCMSLLHISCVAHLPRLRRLDVGNTALFDRGFAGFFGRTKALLCTQSWPTAHPAGAAVDDDEALRLAPLPDEAALLTAWRRDTQTGAAVPRDASSTSRETSADRAAVTAGGPPHSVEFDFSVGALNTLTHVCLSYCVEVRCIAAFALFPQLVSLDVTGTAVDSASLLAFVNVLLEGCGSGASDVPVMRLEMEGDSLRPRALPAPRTRSVPAVSLSTRGSDADGAAVEPSLRRRRLFALTTLTLAWCHYLTDVRCCAALPSLRHLDVCGTPVDNLSVAAFSSRVADALASAASEEEAQWWTHHRCSLLSLDVSCCRRVTDIAPLFAAPVNSLPGSGVSSRRRESSGHCPPLSLMELRLRHSGVTSTKEELRALDPFGRCLFML